MLEEVLFDQIPLGYRYEMMKYTALVLITKNDKRITKWTEVLCIVILIKKLIKF